MKPKLLGTLFLSFAKVGVMTFGGGYAMLPMLQREIVDAHGWATEEELADYYAIGQCTPGVIAVNTATFIGQKLGGPACAAATTKITGESFVKTARARTARKMHTVGASTTAFFQSLTTAFKISAQTQTRMPAKALRTAGRSAKFDKSAAIRVQMDYSSTSTKVKSTKARATHLVQRANFASQVLDLALKE